MSSLIKSFLYAGRGVLTAIRLESNMRIHLFATTLVLIAAVYFNISRVEWMFIIVCIAVVISSEMINTAIEKLSDKVSAEVHPLIKTAKDVSAGAVLITALMAAVVGLIIFIPHLASML